MLSFDLLISVELSAVEIDGDKQYVGKCLVAVSLVKYPACRFLVRWPGGNMWFKFLVISVALGQKDTINKQHMKMQVQL